METFVAPPPTARTFPVKPKSADTGHSRRADTGAVPDQFLARLLRNLPGMAYRCANDSDWTMEFVSSGSKSLTGFDPADLIDNRVVSYGELIHPDDRERVWKTVQRSLDDHSSFRVTYRIRAADGSERWVWEQGLGIPSPDGRIEAIEGFITDITDHRELARRAESHEGRYRALVEQSLAGIYVIADGRFRYVNPRFAETFGYDVDEVTRLPSIAELVHPDDRALVREKVELRLEGELDAARYEFRGLRKDGHACQVEVQGTAIEWEGEPAILGILLDVTARKRAERMYHESRRMNALGRLATGIAHDFNNTLLVVRTTAELMATEVEEDSRLAEDLAAIVDAGKRASALCRELMRFGRGLPDTPSAIFLPDFLEGMTPILDRALGQKVELEMSFADDVPPVFMNPAALEEIVMNLVLNAGDAMPDGGTVSIRASMQGAGPADHPPRSSASDQEGPSASEEVVLEVTDTGVGMSEELRARIFEPYFTTKGDQGTGLGLGNVWRIVNDAEGRVEVTSKEGEGSTFQVILPALSSDV